jgi:hypothetical protein
MPISFRSPALRIAAAAVVVLALAIQALAWLAFEPLLRRLLPPWVAAQAGGAQLAFDGARLNPWQLAVELRGATLRSADGQPLLALAALEVDADALGLLGGTWALDRLHLQQPVAHLQWRADGRLNWQDLADALTAGGGTPDAAPPRWRLQQLVLQQGRLELTDLRTQPALRTRFDALSAEVQGLTSAPGQQGELRLTAQSPDGTRIDWSGRLGMQPLAAQGELAVQQLPLARLAPYLGRWLAMAPPQGTASLRLGYRAGHARGRLDLLLEGITLDLQQLALAGRGDAAPALTLDRLALSGGRFDLGRREARFERADLGTGRLRLARDGQGRFDIERWWQPPPDATTPGATAPSSAPAASAAASAPAGQPGWQLQLPAVALAGLAVEWRDGSSARPWQASVDRLQGRAALAFDTATHDLRLSAVSARLQALRAGPDTGEPWLQAQALDIDDAGLSTAARRLDLGRVALRDGQLRLAREAGGTVDAVAALQPAAAASAVAALPDAGTAWRVQLTQAEVGSLRGSWRDDTLSPAFSTGISGLKAQAGPMSGDPAQPVPLQLSFDVDGGGRVAARGQWRTDPGMLDLQARVDELALAPAQAFLAPLTTLVLAGGTAAAEGRLRLQPPTWRYEGSASVRGLRLDEGAAGPPFLAWERVGTARLQLGDQGARIDELAVDGLQAKVVIARDRSLNLLQVLKPAPKGTPPGGPPFPVDIARVRIGGARVDFADQSLVLPFAARVVDVKGQVVGIGTRSGAASPLELEGTVEPFGAARASGRLRLADPTRESDLQVQFRNAEMAALTPYAATFAGRRIEGGKLTLDLRYAIRQRQLSGQNQVVIDRLVLGERVDSPGASNLPLDLAVALMQDARGRIELGLPVSGDIGDPSFSYAAVVWKALAEAMAKVLASPLRALGAVFGDGAPAQGRLHFGPGETRLQPPELEAVGKLAPALAARPAVTLTVQGSYDEALDGVALRHLGLRQALAQAAGGTPAEDEDPGPFDPQQPETRAALLALFARHFGDEALAALGGAAAADSAVVVQRLLAAEPVDAARLKALGDRRAEVTRRALAERGAGNVRVLQTTARAGDGRSAFVLVGVDASPGGAAPGR